MLIDPEWVVGLPQNSTALARGHKAGRRGNYLGQGHESGQMPRHRCELAQDGSDVWKVALLGPEILCRKGMLAPRKHPVRAGGVIVVAVRNGADEPHLIRLPGQIGEMLANLQAGRPGADGRKLTPYFSRGARLHVEGIDVGGPAPHVEHETAFGFSKLATV